MADLDIATRDGIQTIRFTRSSKCNAFTRQMYAAMADALEAGDASESVRVHVFLGSEGMFSAGNDINDFIADAEANAGAEDIVRFIRLLPAVRKPMIAAVDGAAIGIGTTMLFHCDLVYATPRATFATPFLDLGLVPEAASSLLMPQRMGYARAFEMLALGAPFAAERAREAGLVNAVVAPADLEAHVRDAARRLIEKPPEALAIARRLMRGDPAEIVRQIDAEAAAFLQRLASPEAREAFRAFVEKRPPDFAKLMQSGPERGH